MCRVAESNDNRFTDSPIPADQDCVKTRPHPVLHRLMVTAVTCLTVGVLAPAASAALPTADGPWPGFGTAGVADEAPFAVGMPTQVYNAGLQSNGSIVSVVFDQATDDEIVLQRHRADGSLDPTFGTLGVARDTVPGTLDSMAPWFLRIDSSNRIWVVSTHLDAGGTNSVVDVRRYLANGVLDVSFATGGVATFDDGCPAGDLRHTGFELRPGGGFLIGIRQLSACSTGSGTPEHRVHVHDVDGVELGAFAGGVDISTTDPAALEQRVVALRELPSGDILASRSDYRSTYETDASVVRITAAGVVDPTFAGGGEIRLVDSAVHGIWAEPNGDFFLGAARAAHGASVSRYLADGTPDTSWGDAGTAENAFPAARTWSALDGVDVVTRAPDGRFHACGLLMSSTDGFNSVADYEDVEVRWSADGALEANTGAPVDFALPGFVKSASGCYGGADGRVAHVGWDIDTMMFSPRSWVRLQYGRYDFTPPTIGAVGSSAVGTSTIYTLTASDDESGLEDVDGAYSFDAGATWQASPIAALATLRPGDADHRLQVRDRAGNVATRNIVAPPPPPPPPPPPAPVVTVTSTATNAAVTFTARVEDPAGDRAPYSYSFDGGASWQASPTSTTAGLRPGTTALVATVVRGNDGVPSTTVAGSGTTIDNGKPAVSLNATGGRDLRGVQRAGTIAATASSSYGSVMMSATFRGRAVRIVDGRISIGTLPEGVGFLVLRAVDIDGDVAEARTRLTIDRTAPTLLRPTGRYVLGPTTVLRASDAISGATKPRMRVRLQSRTGVLRVAARVSDRAGNAKTRSVVIERRLALRDQALNRDLKLVARDGSHFRAQKGMPHAAFRFLQQTAPWYSQIAQQDPYVTEAQWRLVKLGCLRPASYQTGHLDLATIRGVQRYQRTIGLEVLGTIGPRTRHALDTALLAGLRRTCR